MTALAIFPAGWWGWRLRLMIAVQITVEAGKMTLDFTWNTLPTISNTHTHRLTFPNPSHTFYPHCFAALMF